MGSGAERMRLYRDRQRRGVLVLMGVEVNDEHIDALMRVGLLQACAEDDRAAVVTAVQAALDNYLGVTRHDVTSESVVLFGRGGRTRMPEDSGE